jgi:hypothetical protein
MEGLILKKTSSNGTSIFNARKAITAKLHYEVKPGLIRFHLDKPSWVKVAMYELTGKRAAMLRDGIEGSGWHSLEFGSLHLRSGNYVLDFSTGTAIHESRVVAIP